jgi:hypothetical protein
VSELLSPNDPGLLAAKGGAAGAELMFLKSTQGRKGNLLIPITAPLRLLPGD